MYTENREKGTSAVEFAMILPLLLLLLFAMIEFGFVLYDKAVITNASREGARTGILMKDPRVPVSTIVSTVNAYSASNLITFGTTTVPATTVSGAPCAASGDDITVSVTYPYHFMFVPRFLSSVTGQINLSAATVMRCE
jgi:Flp pilus assembly protein TadG